MKTGSKQSPLIEAVQQTMEVASKQFHKLVLLVGPPRSGKTATLNELHSRFNWPLINVGTGLTEQLLELRQQQRPLRVGRILADLLAVTSTDVVLLDNPEVLFLPSLKIDPLRVLQSLSRNRLVVGAWSGAYHNQLLTYAAPEHPEYRRYEEPEVLVVPTANFLQA